MEDVTNNLDKDIKLAKEVAADLRTYVDEYKVRKGRAISNVVSWLENYREDYNHRCQLAIDRAKEIEKLKEINKNLVSCAQGQSEKILTLNTELEKYKRIAEANLKDAEDYKQNICEHRCPVKTDMEEELEEQDKLNHFLQSQLDMANAEKIEWKKIAEKLVEAHLFELTYTGDITKERIINMIEQIRKEVENDK